VYEAPLKTFATDYLLAYRRLQKTTLNPKAREEIFISLFETLNWLDALLLRPEVEPLVDHDLRAALRFARGRVHHAWANAIEFRTDVRLPQTLVSLAGAAQAVRVQPGAIADWCWRKAEDLRE
jgi:hypothetical protein